jgi:hypothetical protein
MTLCFDRFDLVRRFWKLLGGPRILSAAAWSFFSN